MLVDASRRENVTRAAQALGAGSAIGFLVVGVVLRVLFADGPQVLGNFGAGCLVAGLGLELYARGLGIWVADRTPQAVLFGVVGSPIVLWHAVVRRRGRIAPEPGAIAGLLVPVVLIVLVWTQATG